MEKVDRIKELVESLNYASRKYYQEDTEVMSNLEYDALYDELVALEKETGMVMSNSPTVKVGYEVVSELPKEAHEHPMLSLDKTKDVEALAAWLGSNKGVISWKLDGLTVVLIYENGSLVKAVTRGNGEIGEIITNNALVFANVPHTISYKGKLTIRGEAVIKYSDFNRINENIADADARYKNPRNLCSGSVRQLNNKVTKERNVHFFAFNLVDGEDVDFHNSFSYQLDWLKGQGFDVVEHYVTDSTRLPEFVKQFADKIGENDFPSDGLVLVLEDIAYGRSLGRTAKFPRDSIAFKWADEEALTHLTDIEWSPSRTGLINPVAIFEPVELEGTTVSRASIHNVSILKALELGIGDEIAVYKANMIIPQIARNNTRSGNAVIPAACPCCGGDTRIIREGELSETDISRDDSVETLYCINEFCPAKKIKSFSHFVSRNAMNIDGMSEATLEKFIDNGFLENLDDLYKLEKHKEAIVSLEGFGDKSYNKLISAIDESRHTNMSRFIGGLGIPNVGDTTAKLICKHFHDDLDKIMNSTVEELVDIDGIGEVIAGAIVRYFDNDTNCAIIRRLVDELDFVSEENDTEQVFEGKVFVITGSLEHFTNRDELKEFIEQRGGKVTGSVSAKTSYLINNDVTSGSSKNKKAHSLGIPILSEEDFLKLVERN
jgi:DNA ligase (NAD+)